MTTEKVIVIKAAAEAGGSSGGSSGGQRRKQQRKERSSPNDNQLSKKQLKEISNCISDANKGPGGLTSKKVRDCYDQTTGLTTTTPGSSLTGTTSTNTSGTSK